MDKGRVEAFSDGVFAVAITLLAFDLVVPKVAEGSLFGALGRQWPQFAAYAVSFTVIGIIWINHHGVLDLVTNVNRVVLMINLAVLFPVVAIPFATDLFATYLRQGGSNGKVAAAAYSAVMFIMAVAMVALYWAVLRREQFVRSSAARRNTLRFGSGTILYAATIGLSFLSPVITLVAHAFMAAFYFFDQVRPTGSLTATATATE